ncbi:bifunctional heptose 7-phosphate kinase/heptose 1-phosphate adenyltransferase [Crocinitomix catalasitica]|uniref:bifunctional heptose 7-phosphate kinase/heptose 1-phosphate adenyltransferase n=1 Tax=Crocinitomix catalasitica TaxID=184607 RepID=UPI0005682FE5|nr:bifunctional ADP-heptose synthase [Crocinitomix catalasitica]
MNRLKNTFTEFSTKKIIVIGDVMIDTYLNGSVQRISPEAPVPIVQFKSREHRLGGAANVALNLQSLGAQPFICTIVGKDEQADLLFKLLNENKLSTKGILKGDDRVTTVKTRVIGNNQQLLRVDNEDTTEINSLAEFALIEKVKEIVLKEGIDGIIFEDYNKGILTENVINSIIEFANLNNIVTTVDPKKLNFLTYKNVTLFKPNLKELREGLDRIIDSKEREDFQEAINQLKTIINPKYVFVTLSENGVYMNDADKHYYVPAHLRTIADVSGAGDTVISVATLCLVSGVSSEDIAKVSNIAGGLVCEKIGVVTVDKEKLMSEVLMLL